MEQVSDLSPEIEQCYYRVAQEALDNVVRHARAEHVSVSLAQVRDRLTLQISDDGVGLGDVSALTEQRFGIRGMKERAEMIGGTLKVDSQSGSGTTVLLCYGENK
jgi:signal transduction histidine kinase